MSGQVLINVHKERLGKHPHGMIWSILRGPCAHTTTPSNLLEGGVDGVLTPTWVRRYISESYHYRRNSKLTS